MRTIDYSNQTHEKATDYAQDALYLLRPSQYCRRTHRETECAKNGLRKAIRLERQTISLLPKDGSAEFSHLVIQSSIEALEFHLSQVT
jgi:hypothetical protein